jgi:hypothetical protein
MTAAKVWRQMVERDGSKKQKKEHEFINNCLRKNKHGQQTTTES